MGRRLYIVAYGDRGLHEDLKAQWAHDQAVVVRQDRRRGERRQQDQGHSPDRRRGEQHRVNHEAESLVKTAGWVEILLREPDET